MMAQQSGFAIRTTLFAIVNFLLFAAFLAAVFLPFVFIHKGT